MPATSMLLPAFNLGDVTSRDVTTAWKVLPGFNRADRRFLSTIIRAIHGVPLLQPRVKTSELEVYVGRSSKENVLERFASHRRRLNHEYGALLFCAASTVLRDMERTGISLLLQMKHLGTCCVANLRPHANGHQTPGRGIVYMTWRRADEPIVRPIPSTSQLNEVAKSVAEKTTHAVAAPEIRTALRSWRTKSPRPFLRWAPRYTRTGMRDEYRDW